MQDTRRPDADRLLCDLIRQRCGLPFVWGRRDCALWAADAVQVLTGRDPAVEIRGAYRTGLQAMRLLRNLGGLHGAAARFLGRQIDVSEARAGDVALLAGEACVGSGAALAVLWRGWLVAQGAPGLVTVQLSSARTMWRAA